MIDSGYEYNDDMLEDPAIPHVDEFDMIHIKVAMKSSHVRSALAEVTYNCSLKNNYRL